MADERNCNECVFHTADGCTTWDCQQMTRAEAALLREENKRMREQIERYVSEFRVCRFCMHIHEDCSPTGASCKPQWGGL